MTWNHKKYRQKYQVLLFSYLRVHLIARKMKGPRTIQNMEIWFKDTLNECRQIRIHVINNHNNTIFWVIYHIKEVIMYKSCEMDNLQAKISWKHHEHWTTMHISSVLFSIFSQTSKTNSIFNSIFPKLSFFLGK